MAPTPAELVEMFLPLARGTARKWSAVYPYLAEDFLSDAHLALWRAAIAFKPTADRVGAFVEFLKRRLRWAFTNLVKVAMRNRRREITSYVTESDEVSLLDVAADDAPEVGAELEAAEEVKYLFEHAPLTDAERELIVRVDAQGVPAEVIAAERQVSRSRVYGLVRSARRKLLIAAG